MHVTEKSVCLTVSVPFDCFFSVATDMKGSLSDQLTETSNAKILRLELENQRLSAKLREMQEGAVIQSAEVNLQLEKENQRLVKRIEKLQESAQVWHLRLKGFSKLNSLWSS